MRWQLVTGLWGQPSLCKQVTWHGTALVCHVYGREQSVSKKITRAGLNRLPVLFTNQVSDRTQDLSSQPLSSARNLEYFSSLKNTVVWGCGGGWLEGDSACLACAKALGSINSVTKTGEHNSRVGKAESPADGGSWLYSFQFIHLLNSFQSPQTNTHSFRRDRRFF